MLPLRQTPTEIFLTASLGDGQTLILPVTLRSIVHSRSDDVWTIISFEVDNVVYLYINSYRRSILHIDPNCWVHWNKTTKLRYASLVYITSYLSLTQSEESSYALCSYMIHFTAFFMIIYGSLLAAPMYHGFYSVGEHESRYKRSQ